jgi:hypothetical protein
MNVCMNVFMNVCIVSIVCIVRMKSGLDLSQTRIKLVLVAYVRLCMVCIKNKNKIELYKYNQNK